MTSNEKREDRMSSTPVKEESGWHRLQNLVNTTIQNALAPDNDILAFQRPKASTPPDSQLYQRNGQPVPPNVTSIPSESSTSSIPKPDGEIVEELSSSNNTPPTKKSVETPTKNANVEAQKELKVQEFRNLFNLPNETPLLETRCALNEKILLQGRIYITENFICFHSGIYKNSDKVISFGDVTDLQKRYTAIVFPNGIEVRAGDKVFNFSSFLSRDEIYNFIYNQWKLYWSKTPSQKAKFEAMERERENHEETKFEEKGVELTDLDKPVLETRHSMDEILSPENGNTIRHRRTSSVEGSPITTSSSFAESKSNSAESTPATRQKTAVGSTMETKSKSMSSVVQEKLKENVEKKNEAKPAKKERNSGLTPPVGPCSHSHSAELSSSDYYICETIHIEIERFWKTFLRGDFWLEVQKESGLIENVLGGWKPSSSGCCLERELNFVTPLNNRLGPKSTRVTSQHRCFFKSSTVLVFENANVSHDVPYGDAFQVRNVIQSTQNPDGKSITIIVGTTIKWSKSVWGMKGIIEKFAYENNKEFHAKLITLVKNKISKGVPETPLMSSSDSNTFEDTPIEIAQPTISPPVQLPQQNIIIAPPQVATVGVQRIEEKSLTTVIIQYVGIGFVSLAFLLLWIRISSLESSLKLALDANFESSNRLTRIESFLGSSTNGKFTTKSHMWNPKEAEEKLVALQEEIRRMSLSLQDAREGVFSSMGGSSSAAEGGFHWIFWTLGFALLGAFIFGLLRYKEKVVSYVAPPTPNIHPKMD